MTNHATVRVSGYQIPLIGVPVSSTTETCDKCGTTVHLIEAVVRETGTGIYCRQCVKTERQTE